MSLSPGARLGPYQIVGPLGAGGMGEVYRARDSKLGRDVAVKVLPAAFSQDPDRMVRFEREAKVLASLNHPHIATIFGVEEGALVMELVEGPTLVERISKGPVPLEEALRNARQIADALEYAHEKGIVHRDLKPANIRLTAEGNVKVLDFGLAKIADESVASQDPASSPTLTMRATVAGVIMGTAGYMAPEQARGQTVDKRADVWAFGVVLLEMLSGQTVFAGETVSDTLASVLKSDPDWSRLPAGTPPNIRRLLRRCLERDAKKRLRDMGDARLELEAQEETPPAAGAVRKPEIWRWVFAGAAILLAVAAAWGWTLASKSPPRPVTRWSLARPGIVRNLALSPDGTRLVYAEFTQGAVRLMLRNLNEFEARPIPGTEGAAAPTFSPDGQWIAYLVTSSSNSPVLKKIPVTGGTSITLWNGAFGPSLDWVGDGTIFFASPKGMMRISEGGGTPRAVIAKDPEAPARSPKLLPGGQTLLFTAGTGDTAKLTLLDLKTGTQRPLVSGEDGRYLSSGHLVFTRDETLFAVPFDLQRLTITGSETPVVEGVTGDSYAVSESGLLVYVAAPASNPSGDKVQWLDRKGAAQPLSFPAESWYSWRISPDGRRIVTTIYAAKPKFLGNKPDVWIGDLERGTLTRLTNDQSSDFPIWTPDGKQIAFRTKAGTKYTIFSTPADGSGKPVALLTSDTFVAPDDWTPDGKRLLVEQDNENKTTFIKVLTKTGGAQDKPVPLPEYDFVGNGARVSPDGHWVAYYSGESGLLEVYVRPFPGPGGKILISTHSGINPEWSQNGRELVYREASTFGQLMAVDIPPGPQLHPGQPQALLKLARGSGWEISPDGKKLLTLDLPDSDSMGATMHGVENWFEELRRLVPTKH